MPTILLQGPFKETHKGTPKEIPKGSFKGSIRVPFRGSFKGSIGYRDLGFRVDGFNP